jgi:gamma-glutamyltranspeptidase / glutathione hydrolase
VIAPSYNVGRFNSRRSPVFARRGVIATAQPMASAAGLRMLLEGGNAIDAAVAAAAVLGVTEPFQTGLGGDCFALVYDATGGETHALNASGPAPAAADWRDYRARGMTAMPEHGPLSWTVPGCVDGWCQMLSRFGSMRLGHVLGPAIHYAREGFAVAPSDAVQWRQSEDLLARQPGTRRHLLIGGRAPRAGDLMRQPALADALMMLAEGGRDAFYAGPIAERLARFSEREGGLLSAADLANYRAEWQPPIGLDYRGHRVLQCPPNGHGVAALLALRSVGSVDFSRYPRDSAECWHLLIEATKHGLTAAAAHVADPRFVPVDVEALLRAAPPARLPHIATAPRASPPPPSDTVYLAVVDASGNAVSFINSVYGDFGSLWMADDLGFVVQNRGWGFSLDPAHPNRLEPGKRSYHTIMPRMVTREGKPALVLGITGGMMQPQGQLQLIVSLVDHGMDVQSAIDFPRFWWQGGNQVVVEDGLPEVTYTCLEGWGHDVVRRDEHRGFGGAQIVAVNPEGVRIAGSEPRHDGCAIGH